MTKMPIVQLFFFIVPCPNISLVLPGSVVHTKGYIRVYLQSVLPSSGNCLGFLSVLP